MVWSTLLIGWVFHLLAIWESKKFYLWKHEPFSLPRKRCCLSFFLFIAFVLWISSCSDFQGVFSCAGVILPCSRERASFFMCACFTHSWSLTLFAMQIIAGYKREMCFFLPTLAPVFLSDLPEFVSRCSGWKRCADSLFRPRIAAGCGCCREL